MIKFFLDRPVVTNLITLFIVVVGGYQFATVRREAFPEIRFDIIRINTAYPGASPEEVERLITTKIENQLRTVAGIDRVFSYSVENASLQVIRVDEDLNERRVDRVISKIEQAVNRVNDLPEGAERPVVEELTSDRPLITLSVAGGEDETRRRFADELADTIEEISGVSRVDKRGYPKREIWIEADREKLNANRLSLGELAQVVRTRNVDLSAGSTDVGDRELWVRVTGAVQTARAMGDFILRANDARGVVRVKDVARVSERFEEARVRYRTNGAPSIDLAVSKLRTGDTITLAEDVRRVVAANKKRAAGENLSLVLSDDWSFFIKRRLGVMTNNLIQGGVLILVALFLFLDWRLAVVAAWGVPISLATAFLIAVPLGFTINLMSLFAFIIVLGMLDDDSVVVAENIYRHLEMGKPPVIAVVDGAKEVVVPVLASVAATACSFLPFAFMSGIMGKFVFMIPVIVILAFASSVFEAFFILPGHVMEILPLGKPVEENSESPLFRKITGAFRRAVAWTVYHRLVFVGIVGVGLVGTFLIARARLKLVLFPPGLIDQFFIIVETPEGTNLDETARVFARVEQAALSLPPRELETVTALVGMKGYEEEARLGTNYAQARVFLVPDEKRKRRAKEIIAQLREELKDAPGITRLTFDELRTGPPIGKAVQIRVRGRDPQILGEIVDRIKSELQTLPGVLDIRDSREGGKNQWRVVLNPGDAAYAGLDVARVAQNILFAVDGGEASTVRLPMEEDEVRVRVRLLPEQRARANDLLGLDIPNAQGRAVPLDSVATVQRVMGPPSFERYNFRPSLVVTADVDLDKITSQEANGHIQKKFWDLSKEFPGYELIYGGEEEDTNKSMVSLLKAFGVAILLNFVILAAVFRSYLQPFLILLTVPIGLLGVVYALLLHGKPASFMALLGVVSMTGVVVNNGIVLVNFINKKREEGLAAKEAAIEGAVVRLRPIAASSVTTLLGLFPSAYGWGGMEPFIAPMALSLAWGLTIAMPMTLFLMPTGYVLLDDLVTMGRRLVTPLTTGLAQAVRKKMGGK